jgi:hypothetical protein
MICDHLVCRALGATCELSYGEAPESAFDKHAEAPPADRLERLERELSAIDFDALRIVIRAEQARRACRRLLDEIVECEKYELALTHDPAMRHRRESKLLERIKALRI